MDIHMSIRSFFVIFMAWLGCQSLAYLLTSECPVPSPCTCSGSSISCEKRSLTSMPQIGQYNTTVKSFDINFNNNSLNTIPNNAFRNLNINASSILLNIQSNNIYIIEDDAFKGLEKLMVLGLDDNNLTTIPFAISKLSHLETLSIKGNPLRSIDPSVMSNIGGSLGMLMLDLGGFTEWPTDFQYLRTLTFLVVNYIPFSSLDINAFRGFENTLDVLTMNYAKLEKVPHAICRLTHINSFEFRYDTNLKENMSSVFEPCGHTLPTVIHLYFDGNNLHNFPDVFSLFPSLTSLTAINNSFQYIENSIIPHNSHFDSILLSNNMFERIPSALNKYTFLETLFLDSNKIRAIESADLDGLSNLKELYLSSNPLAYIDPEAFSHNPSLNYLELQYTQIINVPQAVVRLSNLRTLYLEGNLIKCSCEMSYLKQWDVSTVTDFSTPCANSTETIKAFVMTSLQLCPGA